MADNFQEFVFLTFKGQLADSVEVKHVFPQSVDGCNEGTVIFLPRRFHATELGLKRWRKVLQCVLKAPIRKHFEHAPCFVALPFPDHQLGLAHDDGELFWRQSRHACIVAR